jgi:hypothetical protein
MDEHEPQHYEQTQVDNESLEDNEYMQSDFHQTATLNEDDD